MWSDRPQHAVNVHFCGIDKYTVHSYIMQNKLDFPNFVVMIRNADCAHQTNTTPTQVGVGVVHLSEYAITGHPVLDGMW